MSTFPLAEVIRVKTKDGTRDLTTIAQAATYLKDEFDSSMATDLSWIMAASGLEHASDDPKLIPHATAALLNLLKTENRIVVPDPAISGHFATQN
ncbi:hypothetical protein QMZ05_24545 [Bradyrhizobium sp. INPA03-11B]|uniref:hypothetical protein n=1 Tax=Bradyrhizobium sp. INPA03-11B TaxID=418598 RepID=UPI00338D84E6